MPSSRPSLIADGFGPSALVRGCRSARAGAALDEDRNEADFEVGVGNLAGLQQTCEHGPDTLPLVRQGRLIEDRHARVERSRERLLMHGVGHGDEDGVNGRAAQQVCGAGEHGYVVTEFGADTLLCGCAGRGRRDDAGAPVPPQRGYVGHSGPSAVADECDA